MSNTIRVVSLVPSLTETAIAMGVTPIACTRFCEQPHITHVGGTKNPDLDAIVAMAPDVVVMDREENRLEDADALRSAGIALHVTSVRSVHDVAPMITELAARLGVVAPVDDAEADASAPSTPTTTITPVTAFVPIWRRPWMTISAATYGSSLLRSIGVVNVFGNHVDPYPTITMADVAAASPQVVLLPSEPYAFAERHLDEIRSALPATAVHRIDGQDLFWWGARTVSASRRLRAAIDQATGSISP